MHTDSDVLIVGAGLAGLTCALRLREHGLTCHLFDAADAVGGRVRTDLVEGFRLDRGFQVLLTAYPAAQQWLDYDALDLQRFYGGALVHKAGAFHRVADPIRHPRDVFATLAAPVGSMLDKLRTGRLRVALSRCDLDTLWSKAETTTEAALRHRWGFSDRMIDTFFRPFIGGVTFDRDLQTSSRFFSFVMKMFAEGDTAVPADGMQALPEQLAARLPEGTLTLNTRVQALASGPGVVVGGKTHRARAVVVATEGPSANALVGAVPRSASRSTTCLYFAAEQAPNKEKALMLDGEGAGPVNNVVVMSNVAPTYAPAGAALIAASVVGWPEGDDAALEAAVRDQLAGWFGMSVGAWRLLRVYRIRHALPAMPPSSLEPVHRAVRFGPGVYVCGDHRDHASLQGAFVSGARTADAIATDLGVAA